MSSICIQFGQCGNQLGYEFYSAISEDINSSNTGISVKENTNYCATSREKWFREGKDGKYVARGVLIDTERKVVNNLKDKLKGNSFWKYGANSFVTNGTFGGAANNWALGYSVKGPEIAENAVDRIRREYEDCDRVESIICFSSSAGGTGSGVGSFVTELLSDELPNKCLMNVLVLPFKSGEVVTQNFNTLLTISKMYDTSDGIFLIENDSLLKLLSHDMKLQNAAYTDVNKLIAHQFGSIFQPIGEMCNVSDRLLNLVSHSAYKLMSVKSTPHIPNPSNSFEPIPKWEALKRNIEKALKEPYERIMSTKNRDCSLGNIPKCYKSIGNILFSRGLNASELTPDTLLESKRLYPTWVPKNERYLNLHEERKFVNKDRFLTLVSNNSHASILVDDVIEKSWNTFVHNAYIHQYAKYGVENEDFLQTFLKAETILKDYKDL